MEVEKKLGRKKKKKSSEQRLFSNDIEPKSQFRKI
jgi:hypothetical protein